MRYLLPSLIIWMSSLCFAFSQEHYRAFNDSTRPFFEQQLTYFDAWLQDRGLGQVLAIEKLETRPDMLTVFLYLTAEDKDSAALVWKGFVEQYETQMGSDPTEDMLNYLSFLMEQPRRRVTIELYDRKEDEGSPLFYLGIFYENGQIETETSGSMSETRKIEVPRFKLGDMYAAVDFSLENEDLKNKLSKKLILDEILTYCRKYYRERGAELYEERDGELRIEVRNLEREVLKDVSPGILYTLFGLAQKERLLFIFEVVENNGNFEIEMELHGMFGSGIFSITDSGYRPMEPDYKSNLKRYASRFQAMLAEEVESTFSKKK
ncbi:MAG: hypothetical protein AAFW00_13185 [Bacteroidota bacterium]